MDQEAIIEMHVKNIMEEQGGQFVVTDEKLCALEEIKRLRNELKSDAEIFDLINMGEKMKPLSDREKTIAVQVFFAVAMIAGQV